MKKVMFLTLSLVFIMVSCQKTKEFETNDTAISDTAVVVEDSAIQDSTDLTSDAKLYCCEKHPDVQGNQNDKCLKCGMPLTKAAEDTPIDSE